MTDFDKLSEYLSQAILLEVSAYPKPGLVNRHTNGAHSDMSILTFAMSSVIVSRAYYKLFELGKQHNSDMSSLFYEVRQIGIKEERNLLLVTKGVNTQ